jgi:hypothetical protein
METRCVFLEVRTKFVSKEMGDEGGVAADSKRVTRVDLQFGGWDRC